MKKLHLPLLAGALFLAFFARAQDSLRTVHLEEVVISGNKIVEKKSDIPHQIDLVLQPQISKLSPQTTADALANSGAVFVQNRNRAAAAPCSVALRPIESCSWWTGYA